MALPTFLIVGAMKSGTTSLHRYLGQHPDVFVSKKKELHFFAKHRDRDLGWYEEQFADGSDRLARGEPSTSFTKLPVWPDA
ncbi:MAG: sulfotransferase, partial [Candidatus Nanopelagicales bacterium]|nr:sulfotransferase [Candidatus Nanopelagicales bacterium]